MNPRLRSLLKILATAAAIVAVQPYIEFLAAPPADKAERWALTVAALGALAALILLLYRSRAEKPSERTSARCDAGRK